MYYSHYIKRPPSCLSFLRENIFYISQSVISGRLPAGNVLIFPETVVGAGYRKVRVM